MRGVARLDLATARALPGADRSPSDVVEAWRAIRAELRTAPPLTVGDLEIDGRDLVRLGLKPGPVFRDVLEDLLDWVLEDPTRNTGEALLLRAEEVSTRLGDAADDPVTEAS